MDLPRSRNLRAIGIGAAIAIGASLGVLAPPALAAPSNDNFANRTVLSGPLPIHVEESNAGATRESSEPLLGPMGSAGHSIWWRWEAPATEWVTVSTCESPIHTVVAVFEGNELADLTRVVEGNAEEGPGCLYEGAKTWTFRAEAGHTYAIAADGNGFYVPVPPPAEPVIPPTEGEIVLTLEATPAPPDDGFADATPIEHATFEAPNGARRFMADHAGYNWGATKEPGEPEHAGDPGGASVWFSWIAPESGEASIGFGIGSPGLLAVYTGNAIDELTEVASSSALYPGVHIPVTGGTKYMIAADGKQSETTGEPQVGSFTLDVFEELQPGPGYPLELPASEEKETAEVVPNLTSPVPPVETKVAPPPVAPTLKLGSHKVDAAAGAATFRFASSTKGASFRCEVDGKGFKACSSPFNVKGLKPGKHVFEVVAQAAGVANSRPTVVHFNVPAVHGRRHRAG